MLQIREYLRFECTRSKVISEGILNYKHCILLLASSDFEYSTEQVFQFRRTRIDISYTRTEGASGDCGIFFFSFFIQTKNLFSASTCKFMWHFVLSILPLFLNFDCFSNPSLLMLTKTKSTKLTCNRKYLIAFFFEYRKTFNFSKNCVKMKAIN